MKPERDRCPTCGSGNPRYSFRPWYNLDVGPFCTDKWHDSPEPREVEKAGGGAVDIETGKRPSRKRPHQPSEPRDKEVMLTETTKLPVRNKPGAVLPDARGPATFPAPSVSGGGGAASREREAGMGGDGSSRQTATGRAEPSCASEPPDADSCSWGEGCPEHHRDADSSSGRTTDRAHAFLEAGFDTCRWCGDRRSAPDHISELGDAGSSPASAAEAEFKETVAQVRYFSLKKREIGTMALWLDRLEAAHHHAVADAYDRGFKDASALAANSVRQAREEVEDWILDHWSRPCIHDDSADCFYAMRKEFERRAAIPLDKPAE